MFIGSELVWTLSFMELLLFISVPNLFAHTTAKPSVTICNNPAITIRTFGINRMIMILLLNKLEAGL